MIIKYGEKEPKIMEDVFIAQTSTIIGDVSIGKDSSIWFGVTIRGDMDTIKIGERTNIQDNSVLHNEIGHSLEIGNDVTVGHGAVIHNEFIGDNTLIGMGAILLNDARIGNNCIIGAGSLVTEGTVIPDGQLWFGNPAKYRRNLTEEEMRNIKENAKHYLDLSKTYKGK